MCVRERERDADRASYYNRRKRIVCKERGDRCERERVSRLGGQNEGIKIIRRRRRIARDTVVNRLSRFCPEAELRTAHDLLAHKLSFVRAL